jgi:hypothetical protein
MICYATCQWYAFLLPSANILCWFASRRETQPGSCIARQLCGRGPKGRTEQSRDKVLQQNNLDDGRKMQPNFYGALWN